MVELSQTQMLNQILAEMAELRKQLSLQTQKVEEQQKKIVNLEEQLNPAVSTTNAAPTASDPSTTPTTTRRRLLKKLAGAAALAAAGVGAASSPDTARASDGANLVLGTTANSAEHATGLRYDGTSTPSDPATVFLVEAANFPASPSTHPSAIGGWTTNINIPNGIFGYSTIEGGAGLVGINQGGGTGIKGFTNGLSSAISGVNTSNGGSGVTGSGTGNTTGVYGLTASGYGVAGFATNPGGTGVYAQAEKGGFGLVVSTRGDGTGEGAPLWIIPGSGASAPAVTVGGSVPAVLAPNPASASSSSGPGSPPTSGNHNTGEIVSDKSGKLHYCAAAGTPGTWGQLAPLVFLPSPLRVVGAPNSTYAPGTFASLADGSITYFKMEGSWTDNNPSGPYTAVIPPQATALLATISTVNTTTSGYLTVYPANAAQPVVATMGFGPGFVTSNSITVKLGPIPSGPDAGKQGVAVFTYSNGANVNLAFDVVGYFL